MNKSIKSKGFFGVVGVVAALTLAILVLILGFILIKGLPNISLEFLTESPQMMGREGQARLLCPISPSCRKGSECAEKVQYP